MQTTTRQMIMSLMEKGWSQQKIGDALGVTQSCISHICIGNTLNLRSQKSAEKLIVLCATAELIQKKKAASRGYEISPCSRFTITEIDNASQQCIPSIDKSKISYMVNIY